MVPGGAIEFAKESPLLYPRLATCAGCIPEYVVSCRSGDDAGTCTTDDCDLGSGDSVRFLFPSPRPGIGTASGCVGCVMYDDDDLAAGEEGGLLLKG